MPAPRFSIITAVYNPPLDAFADTAASVLDQEWRDWEWVLVDDCSPNPEVRARLAELGIARPAGHGSRARGQRRDRRSFQRRAGPGTGEFVALLDHDDVLALNALAHMAETLDANPRPTTSTATRTG